MLNKISINPQRQRLIVYICLVVVTLSVYWQVTQHNFINFDDNIYVTENIHVQSGITLDGIRWAFSTTYAEFWHPLTWLSLMLDYQLYDLNAGGYHLTNLILHVLSTLLLFWLFNRMTTMAWRSAFVAALFALHPLHVESVAWIAERKDVLSAFFFMLTLCLYVYYAEKPDLKRYLLTVFCFLCGLMSKPIVVTLPVILILLDYWPLKRLWRLPEKIPFFILSAVICFITLYAQHKPFIKDFPLDSRIANAVVSFVTYLEQTFWPQNLAVFYPFLDKLPVWQVLGSATLIIVISVAVVAVAKQLPGLFFGWFWYVIILLPVIGIVQVGNHSMADRYMYLPLIGIGIMMAWGIPLLFQDAMMRKYIVLVAGIVFIAILAFLTWQQCGYWKNSIILFSRALQVTNNNYIAYNNRGVDYDEINRYQDAIKDYDEAIRLIPNYQEAYNNRGITYGKLGKYQLAINDFNKVIDLNHNHAKAYYNRGLVFFLQGNKELGCRDAQKACELADCKLLEYAKNKKFCY
ncbi:Tetratricopeptide TPR_2 repeat protein [Smithella sp. ME-1]|nr:Tetratricopeptide TPR_2 repeat protein [Smithella sp. ME-1]